MFNDFLFEKNSSDELYFFLHCRFMLFRGPCSSDSNFSFQVIQYTKIEHAEFVVDLVMSKYESSSVIYVY